MVIMYMLSRNKIPFSLRRPQVNLGVHGGSYQEGRMNKSPRKLRRLGCGVHRVVSSVFAALCPATCGDCEQSEVKPSDY